MKLLYKTDTKKSILFIIIDVLFKSSDWSAVPRELSQKIILTPILLHRRRGQHVLYREST